MPARDFYVPLDTPSLGGPLSARVEKFSWNIIITKMVKKRQLTMRQCAFGGLPDAAEGWSPKVPA